MKLCAEFGVGVDKGDAALWKHTMTTNNHNTTFTLHSHVDTSLSSFLVGGN
jgi:hypothetical protein